jgi:hypothetical protein
MLHCHEVWQYNEQTSCQWLRGFAALCKDCHGVKHILFNRDSARHRELMNHFITVNRISPQEAEAYLEATRQHQQRFNQQKWNINYGDYNCWMPPLANKQQRREFTRFIRPQPRQ